MIHSPAPNGAELLHGAAPLPPKTTRIFFPKGTKRAGNNLSPRLQTASCMGQASAGHRRGAGPGKDASWPGPGPRGPGGPRPAGRPGRGFWGSATPWLSPSPRPTLQSNTPSPSPGQSREGTESAHKQNPRPSPTRSEGGTGTPWDSPTSASCQPAPTPPRLRTRGEGPPSPPRPR